MGTSSTEDFASRAEASGVDGVLVPDLILEESTPLRDELAAREIDLVPLVAPTTPDDCFEMLAEGSADLVSVNADTSDRTIRKLGLQSRVTEVID